jgi:hypothetical protein
MKRQADLFWVVLEERQSKNTIYFKTGVATPRWDHSPSTLFRCAARATVRTVNVSTIVDYTPSAKPADRSQPLVHGNSLAFMYPSTVAVPPGR